MDQSKPIDLVSNYDIPPGNLSQIRQKCRDLVRMSRTMRDDSMIEAATAGDADIAFEIAKRRDITGRERCGWLWVAASQGHKEAAEHMSLTISLRAMEAHLGTKQEADKIFASAKAWKQFVSEIVGEYPEMEDCEELSSIASEVGLDMVEVVDSDKKADVVGGNGDKKADVVGGNGVVVVSSIGDSNSHEGKELERRYQQHVGCALPWKGRITEVGEIGRRIAMRWPWASRLGREIESRLAVIRASGGHELRFPPLLLVGAPGCGKTSLARWLGAELGLACTILPCGAANDAGGLAAVTRGWSTSRPSIVATSMLESGSCNPMLVLDEIDKASKVGNQNGSISGTLLSMLLSETYYDVCFQANVVISGVSFIATANSIEGLDDALLDRFVILHMPSPGIDDFQSLLENLAGDFATKNGLFRQELPILGHPESNLLRDYFSKSLSARALGTAFERIIAAKMADAEISMMRH